MPLVGRAGRVVVIRAGGRDLDAPIRRVEDLVVLQDQGPLVGRVVLVARVLRIADQLPLIRGRPEARGRRVRQADGRAVGELDRTHAVVRRRIAVGGDVRVDPRATVEVDAVRGAVRQAGHGVDTAQRVQRGGHAEGNVLVDKAGLRVDPVIRRVDGIGDRLGHLGRGPIRLDVHGDRVGVRRRVGTLSRSLSWASSMIWNVLSAPPSLSVNSCPWLTCIAAGAVRV